MAKIFLSVPILDKPELKMIYSVYQSILSCKEHQVRIYFNENDSLISRVRNVHMSTFLNEFPDCEYFISIDSDLEIINAYTTNNIFTKLIAHDKDFVGGLYALKNSTAKSPICASIPESAGLSREKIPFDSGLIEMKWLSSGCWCIKRSAIEKMVKAYPELTYVGDDNVAGKTIHGLCIPEIFELDNNGTKFKKYLSEDWSFPVDPNTNVLCEGFVTKKIKDIEVGDAVIAFDESPLGQKRQLRFAQVEQKIVKKSPRVKIVTENGSVITTSDHKWLIKRGKNNRLPSRKGRGNGIRTTHPSKSKWEQTKNIQIGDYIYSPFRNINSVINDYYKYGYICGLWDGDGNVYKNKKWNSSVSSLRLTDLNILERCSEYLNHFGIENEINKNINVNYASYNPECHSKLHGIKLCGGRSLDLQVILEKSSEGYISHTGIDDSFSRGYLAGIFDSEGHYDGATIDLCQYRDVNPIIWKKIKNHLNKLNIPCKSDKRRHRITKCKHVHDFFMLTTPACQRKLHIKGQKKGSGNLIMPQYKDKVVSIENLDEGEVICLVTETGTFFANGFASHNCERWRAIGGKIYADTSIVLKHIGKTQYTLWDVEIVSVPKTDPDKSVNNLDKEIKTEPNENKLNKDLPPAGYDLK